MHQQVYTVYNLSFVIRWRNRTLGYMTRAIEMLQVREAELGKCVSRIKLPCYPGIRGLSSLFIVLSARAQLS